MTWIDIHTATLSDKSILIFSENGQVNMYPSNKWKKPNIVRKRKEEQSFLQRKSKQYNFHTFKFKNKQQAVSVWELIEKEIKNE